MKHLILKYKDKGLFSFSRLRGYPPVFIHTYLNSTKAIGTQEALTLCSNVRPTPLKQVDDGGPAVLDVGVVLGKAKPEQSHQNEQLHDFPEWERKPPSSAASLLDFIHIFSLSWTNERLGMLVKQVLLSHGFLPCLETKKHEVTHIFTQI